MKQQQPTESKQNNKSRSPGRNFKKNSRNLNLKLNLQFSAARDQIKSNQTKQKKSNQNID
jgi:hypothetical protein